MGEDRHPAAGAQRLPADRPATRRSASAFGPQVYDGYWGITASISVPVPDGKENWDTRKTRKRQPKTKWGDP